MANEAIIPPLLNERDPATGLLKNYPYVFNEDGSVNWRKMVEPKYLRVNAENFNRRNLPVPQTIDGLEDGDLIILLAGLKKLAKVRGYSELDPKIHTACREYVAAECRITWLPHRDVGMRVEKTGGNAMATLSNTDGFTQAYLCEMAQNRAFARCIRDYLGIEIVSKEEVNAISETGETNANSAQTTENPTDVYATLQAEMDRTKHSFEFIKARLIEKQFKGAEGFESINDIPKYKVIALIKKLKTITP